MVERIVGEEVGGGWNKDSFLGSWWQEGFYGGMEGRRKKKGMGVDEYQFLGNIVKADDRISPCRPKHRDAINLFIKH